MTENLQEAQDIEEGDFRSFPESFRLRCTAHVNNLVAQAFLNGRDRAHELETDFDKEVRDWRKTGPIGKLHRMIVHIRMSPQRRDKYSKIQVSSSTDDEVVKMVVSDNDTRWNSMQAAIDSALRAQARCQLYQMEMSRTSLPAEERLAESDVLSGDDWDELKEVSEILKPFAVVTHRLEGHAEQGTHGSLWEVLPCIEYLFSHLLEVRVALEPLPHRKFMLNAVNLATLKLEQYYAKTDESVAVIAALIMNPTIKWTYLKRRWTGTMEKKWLETAQRKVQDLWDSYKVKDLDLLDHSTAGPTRSMEDSIDSFLHPPPDTDDSESFDDEYERYCRSPIVSTNELIKWWVDNKQEYPRLSRMAIDLLSIPATAAECERLFSGGGLLVTDRRARLSESSIESCECLKVWYSRGLLENYFDQ